MNTRFYLPGGEIGSVQGAKMLANVPETQSEAV